MKKKIAMLLTAMMLLPAVAACGNSSGGAKDSNPDPAPDNAAVTDPEGSAAPVGSDVNWDEIEPIELLVSSPKTENADAALVAFAERVTDRTQGKVTFSFYWGGSLVAAPEAIDALQTGRCDMIQVNVTAFENLLPLNCNLLQLPFMGMSQETTDVYDELMEKYPELKSEFEDLGIHMYGYSISSPHNIFIKAKEDIKVPSDLSGKKLVCQQLNIMNFLSDLNCAPVQAAYADFYTSIQGGVADGIITNAGAVNVQGITDLVNQELIFGEDSGIFVELVTYCMSKDVWNSLPEAVQQVFVEEGKQFNLDDQAQQNAHAGVQRKAAEEAGHRYWVMTDEEIKPWKEALEPYIQAKVEEISSLEGCENFREMYEDALDMIAERKSK